MTNSNFIEIPNSEGDSHEFINADDIASFDYSPTTTSAESYFGRDDDISERSRQVSVESAITIWLKNGKRVVRRGDEAEALRAKLTNSC